MIFLASAIAPQGGGAGTAGTAGNPSGILGILHAIVSFLPFPQLVQVVDTCMPIFNLIGLFILVVGTVQEIPKQHSAEGIFPIILRAIVILGVISIATPLMTNAELLAQSIVKAIASSTNPPLNWIVNATSGDPRSSVLYNFNEPFTELQQFWGTNQAIAKKQTAQSKQDSQSNNSILNPLHDAATVGDLFGSVIGLKKAPDINPSALAGDIANQVLGIDGYLTSILTAVIGFVMAFTEFIMEVMLLVQKAILIFGRPLMPPFIALIAWQGPTRFLGINYNQKVLAVLAWPIGWALVNIGTVAGLQNLKTLNVNWNGGFLDLCIILINLFLICSWMMLGAVMAPMLIQQVVNSGGHFAASMMGGLAGKGVGAPAAALGAAGTAAGVVAGAPGGLPGMAAGARIGGGLGANVGGRVSGPLGSAVGGATSDGSSGQSAMAQYAAMQGMAGMGKQ